MHRRSLAHALPAAVVATCVALLVALMAPASASAATSQRAAAVVPPAICGWGDCISQDYPGSPYADVGDELFATHGFRWFPSGASWRSFTYQWLRDGVPITQALPAEDSDRTVTEDDAGHVLKVRVTYAPKNGQPITRLSHPVTVGTVATTTSLVLSAKKAKYGKGQKVKATVKVATADGSVPRGRVELYAVGLVPEFPELRYSPVTGVIAKSVNHPLNAGRIKFALPNNLRFHQKLPEKLMVRFVPSDLTTYRYSDSARRPFRVTTLKPRVTARLKKKKIRRGHRARVVVRVLAPKRTTYSGRLVIKSGKKRIKAVKVGKTTGPLKMTVRTKKLKSRKVHRIRAIWMPARPRLIGKGVSKPKRLRVR